MPKPVDDQAAAQAGRAERLARVALIIATMAFALGILGLFLPI